MKNKLLIGVFTFFIALSIVVSCKNDDQMGSVNQASLETLLTEANDLITNSVEGINAGDYKPGSKDALQEVVTWAMWRKENLASQTELDDAASKLSIYIERFKANTVSLAIPWIHQESGTMIQILDNPAGGGTTGKLRELTSSPFTLEADFYIFDLQQRGYSNNLFSNVMGEGGANDRGFNVRYFSDGKIHINVGGGNGWKEVSSASGVVSSGKWIHVSFVNNITNHKLYIDGVEVLASANTYQNSDASYPLTIGNAYPWDDRVMNGMVKNLRIWNMARTATQIMDNQDTNLTGDEANLSASFPFSADLGSEFADVSGNFKALFKGTVTWVADGIPPVIELSYTALNKAISDVTTLLNTVVEATTDNSYPIGTKAYLQSLIDEGNGVVTNAKRQDQIDDEAASLTAAMALVNENLVADANGVFIDGTKSSAIGLRITPNYTPQGDYTVEFNVNVKSLLGYNTGEFFNNGEYGVWVYGYETLTEENVIKSGGLWNFTSSSNGWTGPKTDALVMKSGVWQHVAIVHDNTARTTALFVDGVQKAITTNIGAPNVSGWSEMWIGNGWGKMNGTIKNFRLWDVARTQSDLNATINGEESGLKIYLPLDKVAGVKFKDVTGNFDAEIKGISWAK